MPSYIQKALYGGFWPDCGTYIPPKQGGKKASPEATKPSKLLARASASKPDRLDRPPQKRRKLPAPRGDFDNPLFREDSGA